MSRLRSPTPPARGLRQRMSDLHIWAGLLVGWVLYAMFLTGTVSYFKEEISQWMRPEVPHRIALPDAATVAERVTAELTTRAAGSPQWSFSLPDARKPEVDAFWRKPGVTGGRRSFESATFDPDTGHAVAARATGGGEFFYRFHFQFHYMPVLWGRWLAGVCAMFMLVAIVSGVITHKKIFTDFFTFRWGKGQRSWLDAHNVLSVLGLPFHLMITYTGLVTLAALYMPFAEQTAFKTPAERRALTEQTSAFLQPRTPSGQSAPLASVGDMVRQAQARWGAEGPSRVTIANAGDQVARVAVTRGDDGRVSISPQYMLFEGSTGRLLEVRDRVGPAAETRGVMYALHIGRFSDGATRWLYFIVSLAGTAMVGTGLVMWTVKRRARLPDPQRPHLGFRLVERLNIAAIAGLSIAMAGMLWANRLLPTDLAQRAAWEIHVFFIVWAATLAWALLRPARRAWIELLWAATAVLALLPLLSWVTTGRHLLASLEAGDGVFAGMDLTLWALAALHAVLALRTMRHQARLPRARPAARAAAEAAASPATPSGEALATEGGR